MNTDHSGAPRTFSGCIPFLCLFELPREPISGRFLFICGFFSIFNLNSQSGRLSVIYTLHLFYHCLLMEGGGVSAIASALFADPANFGLARPGYIGLFVLSRLGPMPLSLVAIPCQRRGTNVDALLWCALLSQFLAILFSVFHSPTTTRVFCPRFFSLTVLRCTLVIFRRRSCLRTFEATIVHLV